MSSRQPSAAKLFRKKPVVIEAWQVSPPTIHLTTGWINTNGGDASYHGERGPDCYIDISTLEGVMRADVGDWVIRGVKGEFYPCKPDLFEATYEEVEDDA